MAPCAISGEGLGEVRTTGEEELVGLFCGVDGRDGVDDVRVAERKARGV